METYDKEICANCDREIGRTERAYVYKDNVVCQHCYKRLVNSEQISLSPDTGDLASVRIQPDRRKVVTYRGEAVASAVLAILGAVLYVVAFFALVIDAEGPILFLVPWIGFGLGVAGLSFGCITKRGLRGGTNYQSRKIAFSGIWVGVIAIFLGFLLFGCLMAEKHNSPAGILVMWFGISVWGSTVWVGVDSYDLMKGISEEEAKRICILAPRSERWFLGCVLFWILAFPWYLVKRREYIDFQKQMDWSE